MPKWSERRISDAHPEEAINPTPTLTGAAIFLSSNKRPVDLGPDSPVGVFSTLTLIRAT